MSIRQAMDRVAVSEPLEIIASLVGVKDPYDAFVREPEVENLKACLRKCKEVIEAEYPAPCADCRDGRECRREWCKAYREACRLLGETP